MNLLVFLSQGIQFFFQEREMEIRKQALEEERKRREELEKRLQEETSRRQKLIDREVKLREKQRAQVRKMDLVEILSKKKNNTTSKLSK